MAHSILVVDDEKDIVDSLERQFRKDYKVLKATSGHDALKILQDQQVTLIISDQRMPEMTGVQLFERAQLIQPDAVRILLTGYTDVSSVIAAINTGHIYRYVTKPWDPQDLDITVKKAIETYELRGELKIKNEKLQSALSELQLLDKAKSQFMILIGHELKTPLTSITSFTELLKEEKLGEGPQKYLGRIEQGVSRLHEIVFDVLDLLNAELGRLPINKEVTSVEEVVASSISKLQSFATKQNIKFNTTGGDVKGFADKGVLGKVLLKILHNAIKYSNAGSTVEIKTEKKGSKIQVAIENSGPEISKDRIRRLTEPFQIDEDIMNHSKGMGLGLALSQSLLKAHGSLLVVQSSPQKTTVTFEIEAK